MLRISEYSVEQLVFLEESAADKRTGDCRYNWAPIRG